MQAVASELERSNLTLWRIETGKTSVRSVDVKAMCELYGATAEMTSALMALAKETKARGWWQAYSDVIPDYLDPYLGFEADATRIDWYEPEVVPGPFQTADYARALLRVGYIGERDEDIDRRAQLRLTRQAILRRAIDPPQLRVTLRESVIRCPVGGTEIMAAQIERLAEASELPNVALRIVPFSAGFHPGMGSGSFTVLRFRVTTTGIDTQPPTVYCDLYAGALYLDKPDEIARYDHAFKTIWEAALDCDASRDLLHATAMDLR
jgi:hypothetical protein